MRSFLSPFYYLQAAIILCSFHQLTALSQNNNKIDRRSILSNIVSSIPKTSAAAAAMVVAAEVPLITNAVPINPGTTGAETSGIQGAGGTYVRVEGVGGGFDIRTSTTIKGQDVIYPSSMDGLWKCRRVVTSIEGDTGQAELAWRNLGGGIGLIKNVESFDTRFLNTPAEEMNLFNSYSFEGEKLKGVALDRGFEMESRNRGCKAIWNVEMPDVLSYIRDGESDTEIAVVQRKVELPSEKGFGFNELYRVTSSAGGIFGDNKVQRAIRVQRRYRRALDDQGNRVVEGLEIMKTYRVLDGIAGTEMPTSTTKSQIKLTRGASMVSLDTTLLMIATIKLYLVVFSFH